MIGLLESLVCHLAGNGRELAEELVERVAAFQVVDEVFERNSGAAEAGGSAHYLRVGDDYRFSHTRFDLTLI